MSKINHMKKLSEYLNVFRKYFRVRQEVSDDIQTSISFIKDELQNPIGKKIFVKRKGKIIFLSFLTRYIIFNGILKLVFNQRNICLYLITNFFSNPKIFSKDIQIFN